MDGDLDLEEELDGLAPEQGGEEEDKAPQGVRDTPWARGGPARRDVNWPNTVSQSVAGLRATSH